MTISSTILTTITNIFGRHTSPTAGISDWATVRSLINTADNSGTVTIPLTHITSAGAMLFRRGSSGEGTTLRIRMKYDDGLTSATSPVIRVFGRSNFGSITGPWQKLCNRNNGTDITMSIGATDGQTDVADGTYKYTDVDLNAHTLDCDNCNEFIIGVVTALSGTGTVDNATIEAKFL